MARNTEETMLTRIVLSGALPAIAGAAMLLSSYSPSVAFTLSSPSLEQPVTAAGVEHVWWDRWGRWHPNRWGWGYHPWGWHPWGWGWHRHCWIGRWGYRHCAW
jgi:hypothetical protein